MKIDGRKIADTILENLKHNVALLKKEGSFPTLAVILVGDDPASLSFIRQKRKAAEAIGAKLFLDHQPSTLSNQQLETSIAQYNHDPQIHGLIIQRPLPKQTLLDPALLHTVSPQKDVDGFISHSPFDAPVAEAVITILQTVHPDNFFSWISRQHIVIVGRGETAGTPIARMLIKQGLAPTIVHSQTSDPAGITRQADILISCVGKHRVITGDSIKPGAILIGVGMHREDDTTFHGDYEEEEVKKITSFYTPTPGGVGPVNVACLMQNLIKTCTMQKGGNP